MLSDHDAIANTLKGNGNQYSEIVKRYQNYVFAIALRICAGNRELAEDASQQAFLKSYNHLKTYDKTQPFKTWIGKITVNCAIDIVNKEQKTQQLSEHFCPTQPKPEQLNNDFFDLIKTLPALERGIFILKYIYEYTIAEIAATVACNENTIKSRLRRTLRQLKDEIRL